MLFFFSSVRINLFELRKDFSLHEVTKCIVDSARVLFANPQWNYNYRRVKDARDHDSRSKDIDRSQNG